MSHCVWYSFTVWLHTRDCHQPTNHNAYIAVQPENPSHLKRHVVSALHNYIDIGSVYVALTSHTETSDVIARKVCDVW